MTNSLGLTANDARIARMLWRLARRALDAGLRREAALRCIRAQGWV
jgi:hypothetical protein